MGNINSLDIELDGKKIRLITKYENQELNTSDEYIVENGFGASKNTSGTALFIKCIRTKKDYRISSMDNYELVE